MIDWSYDAWAPVNEANWGEQAHAHPTEHDCHVDLGCGTIKKGRIGIDLRPAPGVNVVMDLNTGRVFGMARQPNADGAERLGNGWRYRTPGRWSPRQGGAPREMDYLDYPVMPLPQDSWGRTEGEPLTIIRGLPFENDSIRSIISHHALEHVGAGFIPLMDDIYRVLEPGGTFRCITPLFPSTSAVADPDHCRYFMEDTWISFCGHLGSEDNPTGSWLDSFSVPYTQARFEMLDQDITPRCATADHWTNKDSREIRVALRAVK